MIIELERFLSVCKTGSITKSAKLLNITQPALSLSLKRLEENLQITLINRKNKKFYITKEGKAVYQMGEKILRIWKSMHNSLYLAPGKLTYSLGLFDNAAMQLANTTDLLADKNEKVDLVIDVSTKLSIMLQQGLLDMCICIINMGKKEIANATLIATYFEKLIPVSSKKFGKDIKEVPFLLYNKDSHTRAYIDDVFEKNSINPQVLTESTSITFLKELALLGKGVALLPENFIRFELKNKTLIKQSFNIEWLREIGIFLHDESGLSISSELVQKIINKLTNSSIKGGFSA